MATVRKVLVAIDEEGLEEIALAAGIELAARHGGSLLVLGVVRDVDRLASTLAGIMPKEQFREKIVEHRREQLNAAVRAMVSGHAAAVDVNVDVATGVPFVEVIRRAVRESADIIVQSSRPLAVARGSFLTSGDWHLIRKSPVPVWVVKSPLTQIKRITVAIDVVSEPQLPNFNRQLLDFAATLARGAGAHLSVLSVWRLEGEQALRHSPFLRMSAEQIQQLADETAYRAKAAQDVLRVWLERDQGVEPEMVSWHLQEGLPSEAIPHFVAADGADLIVMGTLGRTGIPGLLIGNTSETILSRIACSVVTMKPSPFVSPVISHG